MTTPSVLLDATAVPRDRGGVGRYVDGLLPSLQGKVTVACQDHDVAHYRKIAPQATVLGQSPRISSVPARLIWEQVILPRLARRIGAEVVHSPHYTIPLFTRRARVVTFHDATFFSDPQVHTRTKRIFFSAWIRLSARLADAVLVPSRSAGTELSRFVRRSTGFDVAYHGVDAQIFNPPTRSDIEAFAAANGLVGRRWIAFLGTIEPRKNVPALVRAYRSLVSRWDTAWGEIPVLAIIGGSGWETNLEHEVNQIVPPAEVRRLGFVAIEQLRCALGGALIVCYPSLGEGFGLPVLEAMACGAPVLTTNRLALPEVGGNAVEYSETDADAISAGLEMLVADNSRRVVLSASGLERSRLFTWAASARVHESVYSKAVADKRKMDE